MLQCQYNKVVFTTERVPRMRVMYGKRSSLSGKLLHNALKDIEGPNINWGYFIDEGLNEFLDTNKRRALERLNEEGVSIPKLFLDAEEVDVLPVVGRTDYHAQNEGFWYCRTVRDVMSCGASHFLQFIPNTREFRVHIFDGLSIKISEKFKKYDPTMGFVEGSWAYPHDFQHKQKLRELAKDAIQVLELDFGAVDILVDKDNNMYVIEVNTAPDLTTPSTLQAYVDAYKRSYGLPIGMRY